MIILPIGSAYHTTAENDSIKSSSHLKMLIEIVRFFCIKSICDLVAIHVKLMNIPVYYLFFFIFILSKQMNGFPPILEFKNCYGKFGSYQQIKRSFAWSAFHHAQLKINYSVWGFNIKNHYLRSHTNGRKIN